MKRILILIGVIIVAGLAYAGYQRLTAPPPPPPPAPVAKETVVETVSTEARVAPAKQSKLAFNTSGRIQEVLVDVGDGVQAGQVVARLDNASLRDAVRQAEASVLIAQTQLDKAKAGPRPEDIAVAEMAVKVAQAQLDKAKVGPRGEDIAAAQAAVVAAQADLAKARQRATEQDIEKARLAIEQSKNELWSAQAARDAVCGRTRDKDTPKSVRPPEADCDQAQATVQSAEQAVQIAQQDYAKVVAGPRNEDIAAVAARVAQAQAQLKVAQVEPQPADIQVAEMQVEQAQAQVAVAKSGPRPVDIAVAQAEVARAEAALQAARTALADSELKAPFAGVVAQVLLNPGEAATPAAPVLLIGDTRGLRLETEDLAETDIAQVAVGQTAKVSLDALPNQNFTAKVIRVSPVSAERRGDTVFTVWLDFDGGAPKGVLWGMKAQVDIRTR